MAAYFHKTYLPRTYRYKGHALRLMVHKGRTPYAEKKVSGQKTLVNILLEHLVMQEKVLPSALARELRKGGKCPKISPESIEGMMEKIETALEEDPGNRKLSKLRFVRSEGVGSKREDLTYSYEGHALHLSLKRTPYTYNGLLGNKTLYHILLEHLVKQKEVNASELARLLKEGGKCPKLSYLSIKNAMNTIELSLGNHNNKELLNFLRAKAISGFIKTKPGGASIVRERKSVKSRLMPRQVEIIKNRIRLLLNAAEKSGTRVTTAKIIAASLRDLEKEGLDKNLTLSFPTISRIREEMGFFRHRLSYKQAEIVRTACRELLEVTPDASIEDMAAAAGAALDAKGHQGIVPAKGSLHRIRREITSTYLMPSREQLKIVRRTFNWVMNKEPSASYERIQGYCHNALLMKGLLDKNIVVSNSMIFNMKKKRKARLEKKKQ